MKVGSIDLVPAGKQLIAQMQKDQISSVAAELAYWFFLALFPFLIFVAALSSFVATSFGIPSATGPLIGLLNRVMPASAATLIGPQISAVLAHQNAGMLSIGILGALWAASGGVKAIMGATNAAYEVAESRSLLRLNAVALGLTIFGGVVIVAAFALFFVGQLLGSRVAAAVGLAGAFQLLVGIAYWVGAFVLIMLAVAFLYWKAPNVRVPFRWTLPGAFFFTIGWLIATWAFALYVSHFGSYNATYGTLGGLAIALLWFYITGLVLLLGVEINVVVDDQTGKRIIRNAGTTTEIRPTQKSA